MAEEYYSYVSTKAAWDCIQTLFLCVPGEFAASAEKCEQFARESGWINVAEENGAVLVAPLAENGWKDFSRSWIPEFYEVHKNDFRAPGGVSIPGRDGVLWLWEVMIYLIGYEDGGDYAAQTVVKNPGFFAASAIFNGKITDFTAADEKTGHWFVKQPHDYDLVNREVPSAVWLLGNTTWETMQYFWDAAQADTRAKGVYDQQDTEIRYNRNEEAQQVRRTESTQVSAATIMDRFFNKILRWKNGPDGQLKKYLGRKDYLTSEQFSHHSVSVNGLEYHYTVYLPSGMAREEAAGLPIVFSIHGRGEPGWVFAEKNGWQKLADETRQFMVVIPDSPYNIWMITRDPDSIREIAKDVLINYRADETRIYLSGFSNGAVFSAQQASTFPQLFAAASPWNGPGLSAVKVLGPGEYVYCDGFEDSGYEMPFWTVVGDSDSKAGAFREDELDILLKANGCDRSTEEIWNGENHYLKEKGYLEGERFFTRVFRNEKGSVRVGLTVMKNMPHGAIWDESRAAWEFMRRFRRVNGNKQVEEI